MRYWSGRLYQRRHTAANSEQTRVAIDRGLCQATHLFNAMSASAKVGAFRLPGALETFLADDRVMVECGGRQACASGVAAAGVKAKGVDRICLVTDATAGTGLTEGAEFNVGGPRRGAGRCRDEDGRSAACRQRGDNDPIGANMVKLVGVSWWTQCGWRV